MITFPRPGKLFWYGLLGDLVLALLLLLFLHTCRMYSTLTCELSVRNGWPHLSVNQNLSSALPTLWACMKKPKTTTE